jgi:hypothetical protein
MIAWSALRRATATGVQRVTQIGPVVFAALNARPLEGLLQASEAGALPVMSARINETG